MRINFYGGPGCGKSTVAAQIYSWMKQDDFSVDLAPEYIKRWAYDKRERGPWDNVYVFGKQLNEEYRLIRAGVDHVVSDSPLYLQIPYCIKYDSRGWEQLEELADQFEADHPSINIFLERTGMKYKQEGRYEDHGAAVEMDNEIYNFVKQRVYLYRFESNHAVAIYQFIKAVLNGNSPEIALREVQKEAKWKEEWYNETT